jgi:DNA-binding transcriptional regulator YbjK
MQFVQSGDHQLQVLASAVTPVVLVSAAAILISGVNARYIAIADRMRSLAKEYREKACDPHRREVIESQMATFQLRVRLVSWAERTLYFAVVCFTSVALLISAALSRSVLEAASLPTFTVGLLLMMIAIVLQLAELQFSNRTLRLETEDIAVRSRDRRS